MLEAKDVCHRCPHLCVCINWEEDASFVPASDPTDGLAEISLEEHDKQRPSAHSPPSPVAVLSAAAHGSCTKFPALPYIQLMLNAAEDALGALYALLPLEDNDWGGNQLFQVPSALDDAGREHDEEIEKEAPDHTRKQVVPLAWKGCEGLSSALPHLVILDPQCKCEPSVLVDDISKSADSFHISLSDVIYKVLRIVKDAVGWFE